MKLYTRVCNYKEWTRMYTLQRAARIIFFRLVFLLLRRDRQGGGLKRFFSIQEYYPKNVNNIQSILKIRMILDIYEIFRIFLTFCLFVR